MASTVQVRIEDDLKAKSDQLFKDLGTDTTTAIRIFLTQAVAQNGFPFEIKRHTSAKTPYSYMTEDELMTKLEQSRRHADEGNYKEAGYMVAEMRTKYGL